MISKKFKTWLLMITLSIFAEHHYQFLFRSIRGRENPDVLI